jgi:hypothetical protein
MFCRNCGAILPDNARFCTSCGAEISAAPAAAQTAAPAAPSVPQGASGSLVGYSNRIHDPAFAKYVKNTNRWSVIFAVILAVVAVVGFFIAGESGVDGMENPEALFIGLGVGGMFLIIALFTILGRKRSRTWDGVVADKTVKKKTRNRNSGSDDDDYYVEYYTEYAVIIRDERGKTHRIVNEDNATVFNYYQVGDRVRHHAGLNSYEKYDKSRDSIIFCSACGTLCDIHQDVCSRCKCPLLK